MEKEIVYNTLTSIFKQIQQKCKNKNKNNYEGAPGRQPLGHPDNWTRLPKTKGGWDHDTMEIWLFRAKGSRLSPPLAAASPAAAVAKYFKIEKF